MIINGDFSDGLIGWSTYLGITKEKICDIPIGIHTYRLEGTFTVEKAK